MSQTYKLQYPYEVDGREIREVTLRRAKPRDLKLFDKAKGNIAGSIMLIAHLCELTPREVEEMDGKDFNDLSKIVADFFD